MTVSQPPRGEMYLDEFKHQLPDIDEQETVDWIRSASLGVVPVVGSRVMSLTEKIPNCMLTIRPRWWCRRGWPG